jgi:hypothetical protein
MCERKNHDHHENVESGFRLRLRGWCHRRRFIVASLVDHLDVVDMTIIPANPGFECVIASRAPENLINAETVLANLNRDPVVAWKIDEGTKYPRPVPITVGEFIYDAIFCPNGFVLMPYKYEKKIHYECRQSHAEWAAAIILRWRERQAALEVERQAKNKRARERRRERHDHAAQIS